MMTNKEIAQDMLLQWADALDPTSLSGWETNKYKPRSVWLDDKQRDIVATLLRAAAREDFDHISMFSPPPNYSEFELALRPDSEDAE